MSASCSAILNPQLICFFLPLRIPVAVAAATRQARLEAEVRQQRFRDRIVHKSACKVRTMSCKAGQSRAWEDDDLRT